MKLVAAVVVIGLSACGDEEVDLTGVYRVDSFVGSKPCGSDAPLAMPPPYVKFTKGEIFGAPVFSMQTCSDEAATNCSGGGLFDDAFAEPIDGGWRGVLSAAFGTTDCTYAYTVQTAKLAATKLVVDTSVHSESTTGGTAAQCTAEEADRRGDSMPCTEHERIDATKL